MNINKYMNLYLTRARNTIKRHLNARLIFCATHSVLQVLVIIDISMVLHGLEMWHQQWQRQLTSYGFAFNVDVFLL